MKALILAAGIGKRLNSNIPKILLKLGQKTLLERHYQNFVNADINKIGLVVGFQKKKIEDLIKKIDKENRITILIVIRDPITRFFNWRIRRFKLRIINTLRLINPKALNKSRPK